MHSPHFESHKIWLSEKYHMGILTLGKRAKLTHAYKKARRDLLTTKQAGYWISQVEREGRIRLWLGGGSAL